MQHCLAEKVSADLSVSVQLNQKLGRFIFKVEFLLFKLRGKLNFLRKKLRQWSHSQMVSLFVFVTGSFVRD